MKYIVTLIALVVSTVGFSQIGENDGATRDDHTTGIEKPLGIAMEIQNYILILELSI